MNLDNIAITLRPRSGWQSIDLGFRLARQWFLPLFVLWCCLSVPVYLLCKLAGLPGWAVLFVWWWLKPLYEAPLYYWCSRSVFAESVTLRQSLAVVPRKMLPLLGTYLTLWRLGTARSQNMNVIMIENLKGKARSARISVISRVTTRTDPLVFVCVHIEVALTYSIMLTGYMMLPTSVTEDVLWLTLIGETDSFWLATSLEACAVFAAGVVAPFYVCSGFSLYLNRRTHLEAWDIDLHFRRMISRQQKRRQFNREGAIDNAGEETARIPRSGGQSVDKRDGTPPSIAASVLGVFFIVCCLTQPKAYASVGSDVVVPDDVPDDQASHLLIDKILAHKDFGDTRTQKTLQFIEWEKEPSEPASADFDWEWLNWLIEFFKSVSNVAVWIEAVLWLIVAIVLTGLIYLVVCNSHHLAGIRSYFGFRRLPATQVQLFDLDIAPRSLPEDIPAAARSLLQSGQQREAMSLLYRGALSRLIHRYGMEITDSATERQCLAQVSKEQPVERRDVFASLTRYWLQVAYGRDSVSDDQIGKLCDRWPVAFDSTVAATGGA